MGAKEEMTDKDKKIRRLQKLIRDNNKKIEENNEKIKESLEKLRRINWNMVETINRL